MEQKNKKEIEQQLAQYRKQYEQIKAQVLEIGFICKGNIVKRWLTCGNPGCRCQNDPNYLHGPYYQISWKEKGKTVSRILSKEMVHVYQQWIENRCTLTQINDEMLAISRRVGECLKSLEKSKSNEEKNTQKKRK